MLFLADSMTHDMRRRRNCSVPSTFLHSFKIYFSCILVCADFWVNCTEMYLGIRVLTLNSVRLNSALSAQVRLWGYGVVDTWSFVWLMLVLIKVLIAITLVLGVQSTHRVDLNQHCNKCINASKLIFFWSGLSASLLRRSTALNCRIAINNSL